MTKSAFDASWNWFRPSLGRKLAAFLVVSNLVAVIALAASYQRLASLSGDLFYNDVLGDQDLLAEILENYVGMVGAGQNQARPALARFAARFEQGQIRARHGGSLRGHALPAPPEFLIPMLDDVDRRWLPLRGAIEALQNPALPPAEVRRLCTQLNRDLPALTAETAGVSDKFQDEGHALRRHMRWLAAVMLIVELFCLVFGLCYIRWLVIAPIARLESVIRAYRDGDKGARAQILTGDELGKLASAFNEMADHAAHLDVQLKTIIDQSPSSIFIKDLQGRLVLANRRCAEAFGKTVAEIIGKKPEDYMPANAARLSIETEKAVVAAGKAITVEVLFPLPGGERNGLLTKFPVRDKEGVVCGIGGFATDITELKAKERDLLKLSSAVEQLNSGIVMTDAEGIIQYVNPGFETMSGYSSAEALGKTPRLLKSGKHSPEFYAALWGTIKKGNTWRGRFINKKKDGTLFTSDHTISPVREADGKIIGFIAILRDISHVLSLEEQVRQMQRLESVGRLAGGVAHDFNNILTAVIGHAQFLKADIGGGAAKVEDADEILAAANRAAGLTRQLLAFSRRQVLEPKVVNLNDLVSNLEKMLRRLIGEDIDLITAQAPGLPKVKADPGQLEQVIMNLTVNAHDAMPKGGRLTIEAAKVIIDPAQCERHPEAVPGRYVMLSISDTGVGMDAQTQAHLFEPFFTTKEPGKGTGLGLSMVYGIVKQSGGHVWVYSELGRGTTFKIFLPAIEDPADADAAGSQLRAMDVKDGKETILLVEDEAIVRSIASRALRQCGYTVLEAKDGMEAERIARVFDGEIQLLLSDLIMPGIDGWELSKRVCMLRPRAKVLLSSGYTDRAALRQELLGPGQNFLQKPFTPASLAQKVRDVLDGPKP